MAALHPARSFRGLGHLEPASLLAKPFTTASVLARGVQFSEKPVRRGERDGHYAIRRHRPYDSRDIWGDVPESAPYLAKDLAPPSTSATQLQQQLKSDSIHPADAPQAAIDKDKAPLDLVHVCLEAYYERVKRLSRAVRSHAIRQKPIASMALRHLWKSDQEWLQLTLYDVEASKWLCFFAVGEGLQDLILDWVKAPLPSSATPAQREEPQSILWRNGLFRALIKAVLAHCSDGSADEALSILFAITGARHQLFESAGLTDQPGARLHRSKDLDVGLPAWAKLGLWPAALLLMTELGKGLYPQTSPLLYNRFIGYIEKNPYKGTATQRQLNISRLHLNHPVGPMEGYAVRFLREHLQDRSAEEVRALLPPNEALHYRLGHLLKKAAEVADRNGNQRDATWLGETYQKHPMLWVEERRSLGDLFRRVTR